MSRQYNDWYFSLSDEEREKYDTKCEEAAMKADDFAEQEKKIRKLEAENKALRAQIDDKNETMNLIIDALVDRIKRNSRK